MASARHLCLFSFEQRAGGLVIVVALKGGLSRWVRGVATQIDSAAVKGDAWHHASDALTSAAAFVGISVALRDVDLGARSVGGGLRHQRSRRWKLKTRNADSTSRD